MDFKQEQRPVSEFAVVFRIKVAASDWNESALKSVFFQALSEMLKDELATLDEPGTLNKLIMLATRLDNHLKQ